MPETDPNPYKQFTPENLQYAKSFIHRLINRCEAEAWVGRLVEQYGYISLVEDERNEN